jgi:hypothetical protein
MIEAVYRTSRRIQLVLSLPQVNCATNRSAVRRIIPPEWGSCSKALDKKGIYKWVCDACPTPLVL